MLEADVLPLLPVPAPPPPPPPFSTPAPPRRFVAAADAEKHGFVSKRLPAGYRLPPVPHPPAAEEQPAAPSPVPAVPRPPSAPPARAPARAARTPSPIAVDTLLLLGGRVQEREAAARAELLKSWEWEERYVRMLLSSDAEEAGFNSRQRLQAAEGGERDAVAAAQKDDSRRLLLHGRRLLLRPMLEIAVASARTVRHAEREGRDELASGAGRQLLAWNAQASLARRQRRLDDAERRERLAAGRTALFDLLRVCQRGLAETRVAVAETLGREEARSEREAAERWMSAAAAALACVADEAERRRRLHALCADDSAFTAALHVGKLQSASRRVVENAAEAVRWGLLARLEEGLESARRDDARSAAARRLQRWRRRDCGTRRERWELVQRQQRVAQHLSRAELKDAIARARAALDLAEAEEPAAPPPPTHGLQQGERVCRDRILDDQAFEWYHKSAAWSGELAVTAIGDASVRRARAVALRNLEAGLYNERIRRRAAVREFSATRSLLLVEMEEDAGRVRGTAPALAAQSLLVRQVSTEWQSLLMDARLATWRQGADERWGRMPLTVQEWRAVAVDLPAHTTRETGERRGIDRDEGTRRRDLEVWLRGVLRDHVVVTADETAAAAAEEVLMGRPIPLDGRSSVLTRQPLPPAASRARTQYTPVGSRAASVMSGGTGGRVDDAVSVVTGLTGVASEASRGSAFTRSSSRSHFGGESDLLQRLVSVEDTLEPSGRGRVLRAFGIEHLVLMESPGRFTLVRKEEGYCRSLMLDMAVLLLHAEADAFAARRDNGARLMRAVGACAIAEERSRAELLLREGGARRAVCSDLSTGAMRILAHVEHTSEELAKIAAASRALPRMALLLSSLPKGVGGHIVGIVAAQSLWRGGKGRDERRRRHAARVAAWKRSEDRQRKDFAASVIQRSFRRSRALDSAVDALDAEFC